MAKGRGGDITLETFVSSHVEGVFVESRGEGQLSGQTKKQQEMVEGRGGDIMIEAFASYEYLLDYWDTRLRYKPVALLEFTHGSGKFDFEVDLGIILANDF